MGSCGDDIPEKEGVVWGRARCAYTALLSPSTSLNWLATTLVALFGQSAREWVWKGPRGFWGLGALYIPRLTEPMQCEFLSVLLALISRVLSGALGFTNVKMAESSKKSKALDHPQATSLGLSPVWLGPGSL